MKLSEREWQRRRDRLESALERHAKSVIENMRMLPSATSEGCYEEAELRRRHAMESFEQIQGTLDQIKELDSIEVETKEI